MNRPLVTVILVLALYGCSNAPEVIRAADIQNQLSSSLQDGSTRADVEAALDKLHIGYSFDKYASRYHGIIRNAGGPMDHAVVVYVYVDKDGRFTRLEARDSYTGP